MSATLRRLGILFSVVLNAAFLATSLVHTVPRWAGTHEPQGGVLPYQALHLTEAQQQEFEPARQAFHARMQGVGEAIKTEELRLVDLLAQPEPNPAAVRAIRERIQGLQGAMQDAVIHHLLEEKAVFTGEQRAHFFRLIRERIERGDQGGPPWMHPGEAARPGKAAR